MYLPLATPLSDADKFVLLCEWCIKTFNSDPKVKSKAQKIFGYGDNPNAFVTGWNWGRCIDEVVSDADLAAIATATSTGFTPKRRATRKHGARSEQKEETRFDLFAQSGEWRNHLGDLETRGWRFLEEQNGQLFFQTPDGDHSPDKQDGNIKDEVQLIESGRSDFMCTNKDGTKQKVGNGTTISQIELKNYLLSRSDRTLLNGKKDIVKVLRGYIDRGQINWALNERTSNLKGGIVKKQVTSILFVLLRIVL